MPNLAVCLPWTECNKNCPYCISKMTWSPEVNWDQMLRNLPKVKELSKSVESVLFTGKGEPLLYEDGRHLHQLDVLLGSLNRKPCELQTNGCMLRALSNSEREAYLRKLRSMRINTLAYSVDDLDVLHDMGTNKVFTSTSRYLNCRVTLNITDKLPERLSWDTLIPICHTYHIDMLTIRRITYPDNRSKSRQAKWIRAHTTDLYDKLANSIIPAGGKIIRQLPYGIELYDLKGVGVALSRFCIQDNSGPHNLRSYIFHHDGHVYTSWDSPASRLF